MRSLKFGTDFMDSAMNNERPNVGEVVGEMIELMLIQIQVLNIKLFNLTYWKGLHLQG